MDTTQVTPEELAAEQAATAEAKEEEVRAAVVSEFGFDEENDKERIDKLVAKELDNRKALSAAIGQKIKWRTEATKPKDPPKPPQEPPKGVAPEDVDKLVSSKLEQRDLDALDYPEDLKKEIQRVASIQGVSIKQATRDPYIASKITEHEKTVKAEEAAAKRTNRSGGKKDYSLENPPEVDMSTPEGRAEWDAYVEDMKKQGH